MKNNNWNKEEIDFLLKNFDKISIKEIALKLNRTKCAVQLKANRIGLKHEDKYFYDKNYFKIIDNEEKAYWLGFIYADGYTNYNIENRCYELGIELSIKDTAHLEKFNKSISGNIQVTHRYREGGFGNGKKYKTSSIRIYCKNMIEDLRSYGVIGNKCDKITLPKLEDKFMIHFLRGYFDGDGCICLDKQRRTIKFDYCSTSLHMLEDIRGYLYKQYNITSYISKEPMNNRNLMCYRLNFRGLKNGYNFGSLIYNNSNVFLDRKYSLFYSLVEELNVLNRIKN